MKEQEEEHLRTHTNKKRKHTNSCLLGLGVRAFVANVRMCPYVFVCVRLCARVSIMYSYERKNERTNTQEHSDEHTRTIVSSTLRNPSFLQSGPDGGFSEATKINYHYISAVIQCLLKISSFSVTPPL